MTPTKSKKRERSDLSKSTGADIKHERQKAAPDTDALSDPKEVWKSSETTPQGDARLVSDQSHGRVADAGDIGAGQPSPYGEGVQADAVARQTKRTKPATGKTRKPKE